MTSTSSAVDTALLHRDRRPILAAAFALVAYAVSALLIDLYCRLYDFGTLLFALVFALIPAQGAAISGYVLARTTAPGRRWLRLLLLNLSAGVLVGLLIGASLTFAAGTIDWAVVTDRVGNSVFWSMIFSLLPLPALAFVYTLERRIGRARPHSLLDAWDRRRIWFGVFVCIATTAWVSGTLVPQHNPLATASLFCAAGGLMVFCLLECAIRLRLQRTVLGAEQCDQAFDFSRKVELDLGVGSELWYRAKLQAQPYRSALRPELLVRGSQAVALSRIDRGILVVSIALLAVAAAIVQMAL